MTRRWLVVLTIATLAIVCSAPVALAQATHARWDIVSVNPPISSGGTAFARADDGSMIKLTGEGTFDAPATGDASSAVTGGGTWETFDPAGASTGSGFYDVVGLVRWDLAPGALLPEVPDLIGNPDERSAGLAVLRIRYSDGSRGILVVSCRLPGAPLSMPEGVSASKGFVDYFDIQPPVPGVDLNRTLFHVRQ